MIIHAECTKQSFGSAPFLWPGVPTVYIKHRNLDFEMIVSQYNSTHSII